MNIHSGSWAVVVAASVAWLAVASCCAQGTIEWLVTFDGSPHIEPNHEFAISYYAEQGMVFTPIGSGRFGRSGGAPDLAAFPRNGSAYLYAAFTYSLAVRSASGSPFGLVSADLAEFSTLYQTPLVVRFIGYKADGSTVTTEITTDGIIDGAGPVADFETFCFDNRFANVVRVEIPTYRWSLDNMVFRSVPEPAPGALLLAGVLLRRVLGCRTTGNSRVARQQKASAP